LSLQSLDELEKNLKARKTPACYVILGAEKYFCRQALRILKQGLIAPEAISFNYTELSAESDSIEDIVAALNTFPMMSPWRLVHVPDAAKMGKEAQQRIGEYLEDPCPKSVLILEADEIDRRTSYFKTLRQVACILDFPKLKGYELERWAAGYIQKRGANVSPASIKKLVDLAGSDLQTLVNEIEKLLLFSGSKNSISDSAIANLVSGSRQHGIFELTAAIGKNDRVGALVHLNSLLDAGEEPLMILSMLARHFRQVLIAKEILSRGGSPQDAAVAAQIPGFLVDEFIGQIKKIRAEEAEKMFLRLAEADLRFKSSGMSKRILLETLLCL
jgi:DNA polymerase III subunit delta